MSSGNGFTPLADLSCVLANPTSSSSRVAIDLRTYVNDNNPTLRPTVFVSTTRVIRADGYHWTPRSRANAFRYDISAPGGINVNPTLGLSSSHRFYGQNEIAFVGGINTRYIFGALELDAQSRYHLNPNYQGNPPSGRPRMCRVPHVYYTSISRAAQFCEDCSSSSSSRRKRATSDELMRSEGDIADPATSCSYCYKVAVSYIAFDQSAEVGHIEPYGHIDVFIKKPSFVTVWYQARANAPGVVKQALNYNLGKCAIIQGDAAQNPRVCLQGVVKESDPATADDDLSSFSSPLCTNTNSGSTPPSSYTKTTTGGDGSTTVAFTVQPCGRCTNSVDNCCKYNADEVQG